ncbi:MAG: hypothetical protein A3A97_04005 [Candidatus Terrybacteria bacterium RIFCSPLOWO2_01_FULL_40_23]|uniref:Uncharacterized protein n=1 Tax=Candidatus Terrybacteria bacterium RIFCSPLOWO2_01_FULL_40_23 TaxID=1802366 RepID=A0A1G2PXC5_9BACT|nr:MAG: hypothetical protein A3A97_04005 [Candidatus Terrybacteria bacterium RIFCSPLOWO2_01_FULL_40_23]
MDSYFINLKSKIGLKIQGTRYNNQTNHNIQYSTAKHGFKIWNLIIGVCLYLVSWCLFLFELF